MLQINPDGAMFAYYGSSAAFTSLAGVSFPVAGAATTPLPLTGGWWSAASQYGTGDPAVLVNGDAVHLEGSAETQPGNLFNHLTVLPSDALPGHDVQIPVYAYGGLLGEVATGATDGRFYAEGDGTTGFTSLAGISYPTATAAAAYGKQLTLLNDWQGYAGKPTPSYYLGSGVAYLYGALTQTSTNPEFAVLPAGLCPAHNLFFLVHFEEPGSVTMYTAILRIQPDCGMYTYGFPAGATSSSDRIFLDGISYHVGS